VIGLASLFRNFYYLISNISNISNISFIYIYIYKINNINGYYIYIISVNIIFHIAMFNVIKFQ